LLNRQTLKINFNKYAFLGDGCPRHLSTPIYVVATDYESNFVRLLSLRDNPAVRTLKKWQVGKAGLIVLILLFGTVVSARAQEFVTLSLSGSSVNFNLIAGSASNPGSTFITSAVTTDLRPNRDSLNVYAFFTNAATALGDGVGNNIPSANFQISDNGGAFQALTNTVPFGGANAGLRLSNGRILGNSKTGTRIDTMNFNIDLSTLVNLPPGAYSGSLVIQVQAI